MRSKVNPRGFYEEHRQNCSEDGDRVRAQIVNGIDFTTSFPFYAGNAKMPAGSYKLTQADFDESVLLIENTDDSNYSAFIDYQPTRAEQPHAQGDVTLHKYGNPEYLSRVCWRVKGLG